MTESICHVLYLKAKERRRRSSSGWPGGEEAAWRLCSWLARHAEVRGPLERNRSCEGEGKEGEDEELNPLMSMVFWTEEWLSKAMMLRVSTQARLLTRICGVMCACLAAGLGVLRDRPPVVPAGGAGQPCL